MLNNINFPVISFDKYSFIIVETEEKLTTTTSAGIKNGLFDNLLIIDKTGRSFWVTNAKKLHGIGSFWGYNIFLNQKIKIELEFKEHVSAMLLKDVRERVLRIFKKDKYYWESGGNFDELIKLVENARSIEELITQLGEVINKEYKT